MSKKDCKCLPVSLCVPMSSSDIDFTGMVCAFAGSVPNGWLKCNGQVVSREEYADLFEVIGTIYGKGDGKTTFKIPDLRGEFIRGFDDGRGVDVGRALGSSQRGTLLRHDDNSKDMNLVGVIGSDTGAAGVFGDPVTDKEIRPENYALYTSSDTLTANKSTSCYSISRPRNIAMNYCIKY